MYLQELTLKHVRQFEDRTFTFQPGFNLLVGENGAGKTTILRSLLATFVRPNRKRQRLPLTDEDIRLRASELHVSAQIVSADGDVIGYTTYGRRIGKPAARTGTEFRPLVLWYSSNEAACGSFVGRRVRQSSGDAVRSVGDSEAWLFQRQLIERPLMGRIQPSFGRSEDIRQFVLEVLSKFSSRFRDFQWSFEPFDCSVRDSNGTKSSSVDPGLRRLLQTAVMRHFSENQNTLAGVDKTSVIIDSSGHLLEVEKSDNVEKRRRVTPPFRMLLKKLGSDKTSLKRSDEYTVEVRLTPRIRILDETGIGFLLSQLSDGEQRLFSLFVDIARQLSLESPDTERFRDTPAIVLIDEIDVHLHPKWQRMIVPALEDLFPACQFIATTHSPFVVQAVSEHQLQHLNKDIQGDFTDRGIEEIAFKVMGIEDHQVGSRYLEMLDTAKEYFTLLEQARKTDGDELARLKKELAFLSHKYARNPAYQAYLELHGALTLGDALR